MTKKQRTLKNTHYTYLEAWGDTQRVVIRNGYGHFVDNVNLSSLKKAPKVSR